MDYPAEGPKDLYALGVPRDAKIVDLRSSEALKTLLAAYSQEQSLALEPYSAMVLVSIDNFKSLTDAFQVHCDGKTASIAAVDGERLSQLNSRIASGNARMPQDADPVQWWQNEVNRLPFPALRSQRGAYVPHQVNYPWLGLPNDRVRVERSGEDLRPVVGVAPVATQVFRYLIRFE